MYHATHEWFTEYQSHKHEIAIVQYPENLHSPPPDRRDWKFLEGGVEGLCKTKNIKESYGA